MQYSDQQRLYLANWLTLEGKAEESLTQTIASARVDMNPHQVEAAMFAMASPLSHGAILADEVGLGKTIEASLVLAQKWAEHKRKLLLIVPATLRKQWSQELEEKFSLPSLILEANSFKQAIKAGADNPFDFAASLKRPAICICSYDFAARRAEPLAQVPWDLIVMDEAHKLRNIYQSSGAKTAKTLDASLWGRKKLLLSATPLQNSLLELYGLVSVIDPHFFGDLMSFKARYAKPALEETELALLRSRIGKICHRTLRRQVQEEGGISFTRRYSMTEDFRPGEDEALLYQWVSEYLQQEELLAIKPGARHLVTLVIRKILASSSYAIQSTLATMIDRLERQQPLVEALQNYDNLDDYQDADNIDDEDLIDPRALREEIEQLKGFRDLAASISHNAKADALLRVLERAFERTVALGGARKAVIFTESVRTQTWLAELLSQHGYQNQIVLLNGSNSDTASKAIFADWLEMHQGSSRISGSRSADMKAALVEKFRDNATLMISTEAGSEGINLQFCSLLINYDLPWNPQRVEQRIGRIHRYGQKHDVVVVNFINKGNRADERVFELLSEKLRLFEGVFGASDDVLGSIESGVDIERRIHDIYQRSRSDEQVEQEFNQLQETLKSQLEQRDSEARRSLLEHFDADVIKRLNMRRGKVNEQLNAYQERLLLLAEMVLVEKGAFERTTGGFTWQSQRYSVDWQQADAADAQFFRPHQGLGHQILHDLKHLETPLPAARLDFCYPPRTGQWVDVKALIGCHGLLKVNKVSIGSHDEQREQLLLAAVTHDGRPLPPETVDRLLQLPLSQLPKAIQGAASSDTLDEQIADQHKRFMAQVEHDNEHYYSEEVEKLERWAEDRRVALDLRIKQLDQEIKEARKASRRQATLKDKMDAKKALKQLEQERDGVMLSYHEEKKQIEREEDRLLEEVEARLATEMKLECLFLSRWTITDQQD